MSQKQSMDVELGDLLHASSRSALPPAHGSAPPPPRAAAGATSTTTTTTTNRHPPSPPPSAAGYTVHRGAVGAGSFGQVYRATRRADGADVALKRMGYSECEAGGVAAALLRESAVLRLLGGVSGCIELLEVLRDESSPPSGRARRALLVFPFYDFDLATLLRLHASQFEGGHVRSFVHQLASALAYSHSRGVMHRDVKSDNVLVGRDLQLKLADWGQAAIGVGGVAASDGGEAESPPARRSGGATSMWYRAPEILFGSRHYDEKVDVWSMGCVVAELLRTQGRAVSEQRTPGRAVMRGRDVEEQGRIAIGVCGAPAADSPLRALPGCPAPSESGKRRPHAAATVAAQLDVVGVDADAERLLEMCVTLEPCARATAVAVRDSPFCAAAPLLATLPRFR